MRQFTIVYGTEKRTVFASNHVVARRLGTRMLANELSVVEPSKVAVIDPAVACPMPTEIEIKQAVADVLLRHELLHRTYGGYDR